MSGRLIRGARGVLGWSTKDLAERAKVGVATINRFEKEDGIYEKATITTAKAIMGTIEKGLSDIGWRLTAEGGISPVSNI